MKKRHKKRRPDSVHGLYKELDQVSSKHFEYKLFHDMEAFTFMTAPPARFWHVNEFYPSYILFNSPCIVEGQMPIDLPWFYAWLTVMDGESREGGFLVANLDNVIPPKHFVIGTFAKRASNDSLLARYYRLRTSVKGRIEAFWNALPDWHPVYERMKALSQALLFSPIEIPPELDVEAAQLEIREFESQVDRFFEPFLAGETMDQFYARWMTEIEQNERRIPLEVMIPPGF